MIPSSHRNVCFAFNQSVLGSLLPECIAPRTTQVKTRGSSMEARSGQNHDNKIAPQVNFKPTAANIMDLGPVVQKVDSAIQRTNLYPVVSAIGFPDTYPLDSDLPCG